MLKVAARFGRRRVCLVAVSPEGGSAGAPVVQSGSRQLVNNVR